jgi:TonB family protein
MRNPVISQLQLVVGTFRAETQGVVQGQTAFNPHGDRVYHLSNAVEVPRLKSGAPPSVPALAVGWGDVRLEAIVGADGRVAEITTLRTTPPYTDALREAVAGWRFEPAATKEGPADAHVLIVGIFRPRVLYDTPVPGTPPVDVAQPSSNVPAPLEIPTPVYPVRAVGDGVVVVEMLIGPDGATREMAIAISTGAGFEDSALRAASQARFRPAHRGGVPVAGRVYLVFGFRQPVVQPRHNH